jgi:hypothetical protein
LFGAIKVILHGCLCWSKPIQNAEEVMYWTRYIFTTWVCTVFGILATFWIFTIKDTTKSWDFVLLTFPLFIFSAHESCLTLLDAHICQSLMQPSCFLGLHRVIYHITFLFLLMINHVLSLFQSALSFLMFQFIPPSSAYNSFCIVKPVFNVTKHCCLCLIFSRWYDNQAKESTPGF